MATWEQVLLGIAAFVILIVFWPGAKAMLEQSRRAENPDWKGALVPIGAVVLFIILLVLMSRA